MTACWVLHSRLIYFWRNRKISSIFYFPKLTSINTQYSSLWDTLKMMLFTKYLIKCKSIGRISWKFRYWFYLKSFMKLDIKKIYIILVKYPLKLWHDQGEWVRCRKCWFWVLGLKTWYICMFYIFVLFVCLFVCLFVFFFCFVFHLKIKIKYCWHWLIPLDHVHIYCICIQSKGTIARQRLVRGQHTFTSLSTGASPLPSLSMPPTIDKGRVPWRMVYFCFTVPITLSKWMRITESSLNQSTSFLVSCAFDCVKGGIYIHFTHS